MHVVKCKYKPGQKVFRLEVGIATEDVVDTIKTQSLKTGTGIIYEMESGLELPEDSLFENTRDIAIHLGLVKPVERKKKELAPPPPNEPAPPTE